MFIAPGKIYKNGRWQRNNSPHHLEMDDLRGRSGRNAPPFEVATVEGSYYISLGVDGRFQQTYLRATTNEYQAVREWRTEYGRFLADTDMDTWTKVCVIGSKIWKEQFKGQDPIGKEVIINNHGNNKRFTVIGIMESRGDGLERGLEVMIICSSFRLQPHRNGFGDTITLGTSWCVPRVHFS